MKPVARPWVLGLSASHNGSACLLHGDELVVAVQEERLTGVKRARVHGAEPALCVEYCLREAGITPKDLAMVAIAVQGFHSAPEHDLALNPQLRVVHHGVPTLAVPHHLAHAASAYATSGFRDAAVLVVDGAGSPHDDLPREERAVSLDRKGWEWCSTYDARGVRIAPVEKHLTEHFLAPVEVGMPRFGSLGGIFSACAQQIFGEASEAGKVMGLAPYGRPSFAPADFFALRKDGRFAFSDAVPARFAHDERWPAHQQAYQDLAAAAQGALEEALLHLARRLRKNSRSKNLCYAGGVALNSVANERLVREAGFENVFVIPPAEDSGPSIGAAYLALWKLTRKARPRAMLHDALGAAYSNEACEAAIAATPVVARAQGDVVERTVDLLADGKIVGWFQGRSELGPRALGQRSILCDPRRPDGKETLNRRVKHREPFRPFAPAILLEEAHRWFDTGGFRVENPFMLRVWSFLPDQMARVPAVAHVDGTGRTQTLTAAANGRFHALVSAFHRRTGVPILLNTSFNVMGEPIVETPEDALFCLLATGLDACVLEDHLVLKPPSFQSVLDLTPRPLAYDLAVHREWLEARVETRWGPAKHVMSSGYLPLLERIDGHTSGRALLEALAKDGFAPEENRLIRALGSLRRAGLIALTG